MFNRNQKKSGQKKMSKSKTQQKNDVPSVNMVSEGTEIIGTLKTRSDIRIAGNIDGEAAVDGKIIVASTGHIDGNIKVTDADIAGRVEGEVHTSGKLILRQSAVVEGDLYAQSLVVEEGGTFNGVCHMRDAAAEEKSENNTAAGSSEDKEKEKA